MFLHYDTETEGLNVNGVPSDDPRQPNVVSITAILDDQDGNTLETVSTLIKPDGWAVDERLEIEDPAKPGKMIPTAFSIHGITNERALAEGIPLADAMERVAAIVTRAHILSAFNHFFDFKMMKISCHRMIPGGDAAMRELFESKSAICTMDAARKHLKAGRFIKLQDAYMRLFDEPFSDAHSSLADTQAHRRIFYQLRSLGALPEPKSLARKEYATPYQATV